MERAWLVEQTGLDRPYWLCGPCPGYVRGTFPLAFSADANDAVRFCREQDARRIAAYGPSDVEQFDREQDAEWALAHARYLLTKRRHAAKADPEGTRLGRRHRRQQRYLSAVALGKITPNDDHERQCFEPTPNVAPVGWCERKQKT